MFQLSVVAVVLSAWYGGLGPGLGRSITVSLGTFPACRADPTLLRVVFTNLLHNALKFTRAKGEARIEVGCLTAGEPVYYVKDNGVGFDMQYAGQLFGIFQRLHREDAFEGTGVGLAIVQRIGHRHGGRIWAEARPGLGAAFYFTLGGKQA
jgi:light-regulated signal transduction histidine kinase (bacteriophytochrome)